MKLIPSNGTLYPIEAQTTDAVQKLADYLIGTGGWAYFKVPGLRSLVAYSRLFSFVEVNSTFYQIPNLKTVESWRRQVSPDFLFSVRCNRDLTHKYQFQPNEEAHTIFQQMVTICRTLRTDILHVQTPTAFEPNRENADLIDSFLSSADSEGVRLALEVRGSNQALGPHFVKMMQDHSIIHSIDLSRDEESAYKSDILYSRLFGKGWHNVYQPTDQELKRIDDRASASAKSGKKTIVSFHFIRMYKDAARLKTYRQTGKFPMITRSTGLKSLDAVLKEDARFPSTKQELVQDQGWKLIDLTEDTRVRSSEILEKLPERSYDSVEDVTKALKGVM